MDLGQWGVYYFTDVLTPAQLTELAQRTEQLGYTALWYPEVLGYESFALGSFLLTQTTRLIIASGIANMYARDATAAKQGKEAQQFKANRSLRDVEPTVNLWLRNPDGALVEEEAE